MLDSAFGASWFYGWGWVLPWIDEFDIGWADAPWLFMVLLIVAPFFLRSTQDVSFLAKVCMVKVLRA
jgi:hypothetical protein